MFGQKLSYWEKFCKGEALSTAEQYLWLEDIVAARKDEGFSKIQRSAAPAAEPKEESESVERRNSGSSVGSFREETPADDDVDQASVDSPLPAHNSVSERDPVSPRSNSPSKELYLKPSSFGSTDGNTALDGYHEGPVRSASHHLSGRGSRASGDGSSHDSKHDNARLQRENSFQVR